MSDTPQEQPSSPVEVSPDSAHAVVHKHGLQIIGLLALALVGISACFGGLLYFAGRNTTTTTTTDNGTIPQVTAILSTDKISGIFPNSQSETFEVKFQANIFQGLTKIDTNGTATGLLAKQWSNPDASTWIFDLQPNAVFSNGDPVKASDVAFSINQSLKNSWPGSELIPSIDTATATSDHQVKITTKGIDPVLLNELEQIYIVDEKQFTTKKDNEYAIGSGPYVLESFTSDPNGPDKYVLKVNPHYYLAKPRVQQVNVIVPGPDDNPIDYGLSQKANVVFVSTPSDEDVAKLSKAGYQVKNMGSNSVEYIGLDAMRSKTPYIDLPVNPLSKLAVRQALAKAIDGPSLSANPPEVGLQYANQMAPASVFGSDPSIKASNYDPEGAKKLLTDAGYPNGFTMTLDAPAFVEPEVTPVIKDWKDVLNVTVKFNPLDKDTGLPKLQSADSSAYYLGWDYSTYDMAAIFPLLDKNDLNSNFLRYSNAQASSLVDKISTTINLQQRKTLLQQLGKVILDDAAYIPLWIAPDLYAVKSGLNFPTAAPATWSGS